MSKDVVEIIKSGLETTVQDMGRYGYQKYGIVPAGAMDFYSAQLANILVGNCLDAALLEVTLLGPEIKFKNDCLIAISGAELSPTLNDSFIGMWKSIKVSAGDILNCGQAQAGLYSYIAISGGIEVPKILESRSTYIEGEMGGFKGKALEKGDILKVFHPNFDINNLKGTSISTEERPNFLRENRVRVVLGPDQNMFLKESIDKFLSEKFQLTTSLNRKGYRLKGPKLKHNETADIISDAIQLGTIQVPSNGQPIVLMADRQTTGGYARIATVISHDIPYMVQKHPYQSIYFEETSIGIACDLLRKRESYLQLLFFIIQEKKKQN